MNPKLQTGNWFTSATLPTAGRLGANGKSPCKMQHGLGLVSYEGVTYMAYFCPTCRYIQAQCLGVSVGNEDTKLACVQETRLPSRTAPGKQSLFPCGTTSEACVWVHPCMDGAVLLEELVVCAHMHKCSSPSVHRLQLLTQSQHIQYKVLTASEV